MDLQVLSDWIKWCNCEALRTRLSILSLKDDKIETFVYCLSEYISLKFSSIVWTISHGYAISSSKYVWTSPEWI